MFLLLFLDVPESPKIDPSTGPIYTTRRFTFTYHDNNRWAVSVDSIHFKQTRIEHDYGKRYDTASCSCTEALMIKKTEVPHCNICENLALCQPSFL